MSFWTVPRMWAGESVGILASGDSMSQEVADRARARNDRTIAINTTVKLAMWADMLFAADARWWIQHQKDVQPYRGMRVTFDPPGIPDLLVLRLASPQDGYSDDPGEVRNGGNGGYAAVCLAALAGAKVIRLYGYDFKGDGHWHGKHPTALYNAPEGIWPRRIKRFNALAPELAKRGVDVINCTPGSALQCFRFEDECALHDSR